MLRVSNGVEFFHKLDQDDANREKGRSENYPSAKKMQLKTIVN